jgi:hypothetical protein
MHDSPKPGRPIAALSAVEELDLETWYRNDPSQTLSDGLSPPLHRASNPIGAKNMTENMRNIPSKRPENETPIVIDSTTDAEEQRHKKMERMADRAAHKANKTQQEFDEGANSFSNIGPH